jgi:hypothetical protein
MNILLFLTYWAVRVVEWFGQLYDRARGIIIQFDGYLQYAASIAIGQVLGYVTGLVNNITSGVMGWILQYYNIAVSIISSVRDWLLSVIYAARDAVYSFAYSVRDYAVYLYNQAVGYASAIYGWAESFVNGAVNGVLAYFSNSLYWLYAIRDAILNILSFFSFDKLSKLVDLLGRMFPTLLLFINDPLGFMLDLLQTKFISFLCYVLAHGLGTTVYTLPTKPPWKG